MNKTKKYKLKLDYVEDELQELKELSKTDDSPIYAISELLIAGTHGVENLQAKYLEMRHEDEFYLMADINNVIMGTAVFPNKLYIVHDKATDQYVYCGMTQLGLCWGQPHSDIAETHTKEEWLAFNPAYEPMLERVEYNE